MTGNELPVNSAPKIADLQQHQDSATGQKPAFAFQDYNLHTIMTAASLANHMSNSHKLPVKPNPSPFRQMLPVALCLISFATVLSVLIIYMDTTGEL